MLYRKRPVIVDVIQFIVTEEIKCKFGVSKRYNGMDICEFMKLPKLNTHFDKNGAYLTINTLEGAMRVDVNDYIIKGVDGELYPCKPDIFRRTYELVKNEEEVNCINYISNESYLGEKEASVMTKHYLKTSSINALCTMKEFSKIVIDLSKNIRGSRLIESIDKAFESYTLTEKPYEETTRYN